MPEKLKILLDVSIDLDSGDFETKLKNVSHPGEAMDYQLIKDVLAQTLKKMIAEENLEDSENIYTNLQ